MIGTLVHLTHPWTHEAVDLPVECVTRTHVSVRWGQSGIYDISVTSGEAVPRSLTARNRAKGKQKWVVADLADLRDRARIHLDGIDKRAQVRMATIEHEKTMPGKDGRDLSMSVVRRILGARDSR